MIVLKKETDSTAIAKICETQGLEYNENVGAFVAKDREEILGYSLFSVKEDLTLIDIETSPILWKSIGDGLFRATINFAIENGISPVKIEDKLLEKLTGDIILKENAKPVIEDCEKFLQESKRCAR